MTAASAPASSEVVDVFEVVSAGLLTMVQDAGRPGLEALGVPTGGAADPLSFALANLLVGNEPGMAAIECTLLGPRLRALREVTIGLGGADLGGRLLPGGWGVRPWVSHRIAAGEVLAFAEVEPDLGCRAYVAVPGGFDVPPILGSRSTSLVGAFGGLEGRALRAGDRLSAHLGTTAPGPPEASWPAELPPPALDAAVRVLAGPAAVEAGGDGLADSFAQLVGAEWSVSHDSDRRGLRLDGPSLSSLEGGADLPSQGILPGAIQLTPTGQPIVLMPDAGTTGGYPVIGVVCAADLWLLGQLRPGSRVRFTSIDAPAARAAASAQQQFLADGATRIGARLS